MYQNKKVIHICCVAKNGAIGKDNQLLFKLPPDLKFFREQTLGHTVLMGRKTVDSLPKPLERRVTIKVTKKPFEVGFGTHLIMDLEDYLKEAVHVSDRFLNTDKIFVAGGSQLYTSTFDIADELWLTEVDKEVEDTDAFYHIPDNFEMSVASEWLDYQGLNYRFTRWSRKEV